MHTFRWIVVISIMLVTLSFFLVAAQAADGETAITKQQAKTIAQNIVGIEEGNGVLVEATQETLSPEEDIPFLVMAGRPVWRVVLSNIHLSVRFPRKGKQYEKPDHEENGGRVMQNSKIHSLVVIINQSDGAVIKIIANSETPKQNTLSVSTQQQCFAGRSMQITSLAKHPSQLTFLQLLQSVQEGLGGVLVAPQIEAFHVQYLVTVSKADVPEFVSGRDDGPRERWLILLKGLPPVFSREPDNDGTAKEEPLMNVVHELDPISGEWIRAFSLSN